MLKLIAILFYFLAAKVFALSNNEINKIIREYLNQNEIFYNFNINKKLKLPNCEKNI